LWDGERWRFIPLQDGVEFDVYTGEEEDATQLHTIRVTLEGGGRHDLAASLFGNVISLLPLYFLLSYYPYTG
jgi:hypothetical protein